MTRGKTSVLSLMALLVGGCGQAPPEVPAPPAAPVEVVRATKEVLDEWTAFPGTTEAPPNRQARVTAAVEGIVLSIPGAGGPEAAVAVGQWVEAGQVIVRLDDRIARDALAKANAGTKELDAQVTQAEYNVKAQRTILGRYQDLLKPGSSNTILVSKADLETAQLAVKNAEAQQQVFQAQQSGSKASVQGLESQLKLFTLRAPIAGWLGPIQVVPGQTISISTPVADIIDLRDIDVSCFVPPSRIDRLVLGQPARVVRSGAPAPTGPEPEGKVVYIGRQGQSATGSFEVKVRFPNKDLKLAANSFAQILVQTTPPLERLVIPIDALMEDQEPPGVVVVPSLRAEEHEKLGKVRLLQAVLGVYNRQRRLVEVLKLEDPTGKEPVPPLQDAWFVVTGGHGLEDGDEVRVQEADKEHK